MSRIIMDTAHPTTVAKELRDLIDDDAYNVFIVEALRRKAAAAADEALKYAELSLMCSQPGDRDVATIRMVEYLKKASQYTDIADHLEE